MKLPDQRVWFGAIAVLALILLTLIAAPANPRSSGSTYSRAPDGYGAWYAYMEVQGTPVKRWQKPLKQLPGANGQSPAREPITFLQINSAPASASFNRQWIEQGNTLVILGASAPVSQAAFTTFQDSPAGNVRIDTRRRIANLAETEKQLLGDRFGTVVWQEPIGKGRLVVAITPHLAANAYQDVPGNYKFLAQLVTHDRHPIWVDEYLHGYKDAQEIQKESKETWYAYLAKTPLLPVAVQGFLLLLIAIWAQNKRFGQPELLTAPTIDNSTAYIQALASVLHKAQSSEFLLEVVGNEEKLQIQSALGLGRSPIAYETLRDAWVKQTGRSTTEFDAVFQLPPRSRRMTDQDLLTWLRQLQSLRNSVP